MKEHTRRMPTKFLSRRKFNIGNERVIQFVLARACSRFCMAHNLYYMTLR